MKCPFCGAEFEEPRIKCSGCPMHSSCRAVCCPNCGYELSRESKLVDLAKRLFDRVTTITKARYREDSDQ